MFLAVSNITAGKPHLGCERRTGRSGRCHRMIIRAIGIGIGIGIVVAVVAVIAVVVVVVEGSCCCSYYLQFYSIDCLVIPNARSNG